jgi:hypothetical protein
VILFLDLGGWFFGFLGKNLNEIKLAENINYSKVPE